MKTKFEDGIRELTKPINGQLPRPWMTKMTDPLAADVFIVGKNQSREYPTDQVSHERHLNALFNRNGESCRGLYDEVTGGKGSPTRRNIDELSGTLERHGIDPILETNVVCYSTNMSKDLRAPLHAGGERRGDSIFRYLLKKIQPRVLIVHGKGTCREIANILGLRTGTLRVPTSATEVCDIRTDECLVIPIPSLAPPGWRKWHRELMGPVAARVKRHLETTSATPPTSDS